MMIALYLANIYINDSYLRQSYWQWLLDFKRIIFATLPRIGIHHFTNTLHFAWCALMILVPMQFKDPQVTGTIGHTNRTNIFVINAMYLPVHRSARRIQKGFVAKKAIVRSLTSMYTNVISCK